MKMTTLLLPFLLLVALVARADEIKSETESETETESEPARSPEEIWYFYSQGVCQEKSPMELMVFAQLGGVHVKTLDVEEKGEVVSSAVTLTDRRTHRSETYSFYRGKKRCDAVRQAAQKKFEGMVDRYR